MTETTYTIDEIDQAIRKFSGEFAARPGDPSWHRSMAMLSAAAQLWIDEPLRVGRDVDVLRQALRDLNKYGHLKPRDGVWPDE